MSVDLDPTDELIEAKWRRAMRDGWWRDEAGHEEPEPDAIRRVRLDRKGRVMRIGVVACSKTKANTRCAAVDLYQGRIFRAAVALLRAQGCERIVILSALHHAVADTHELAPYDLAVCEMDAATRHHWTMVARASLSNVLAAMAGSCSNADVHAIVPMVYAGALDGLPRVTRHFVGLSQGRLCSALTRALDAMRAA